MDLVDADRRVVAWALQAVGAAHLADRDFSRLSDGERQRVMIARALAQEPVLLMLDEPTAFLDVPSRVELMALLRQLTRAGQLAVVIATHDLELALRTADVVWLMMPGGEIVTGAPEDVVLGGGDRPRVRGAPDSLSPGGSIVPAADRRSRRRGRARQRDSRRDGRAPCSSVKATASGAASSDRRLPDLRFSRTAGGPTRRPAPTSRRWPRSCEKGPGAKRET